MQRFLSGLQINVEHASVFFFVMGKETTIVIFNSPLLDHLVSNAVSSLLESSSHSLSYQVLDAYLSVKGKSGAGHNSHCLMCHFLLLITHGSF